MVKKAHITYCPSEPYVLQRIEFQMSPYFLRDTVLGNLCGRFFSIFYILVVAPSVSSLLFSLCPTYLHSHRWGKKIEQMKFWYDGPVELAMQTFTFICRSFSPFTVEFPTFIKLVLLCTLKISLYCPKHSCKKSVIFYIHLL